MKPKFDNQSKLDFLNKTSEKINDISKEIRAIQNDENLTSTEKRDNINILSKKRNDIARTAQNEYKGKW